MTGLIFVVEVDRQKFFHNKISQSMVYEYSAYQITALLTVRFLFWFRSVSTTLTCTTVSFQYTIFCRLPARLENHRTPATLLHTKWLLPLPVLLFRLQSAKQLQSCNLVCGHGIYVTVLVLCMHVCITTKLRTPMNVAVHSKQLLHNQRCRSTATKWGMTYKLLSRKPQIGKFSCLQTLEFVIFVYIYFRIPVGHPKL